MKTHPYSHLLAVVCAGALASCANHSAIITKVPVSASFRPDASKTTRLFQEVNSYRRSQGARELERHAGLDQLAQAHCEYLRQHRGTFVLHGKNVSHCGFDGRVLVARERYQMLNISENVAAGNTTGTKPEAVLMHLWEGSKDHHKNLVNNWTHTGVGMVVDSDGMVFGTELFATVGRFQMERRERFTRF